MAAGACPAACDGKKDCQACLDCATAGLCQSELDACQNDAECLAFYDCYTSCQDQACVDACSKAHPTGVAPYNALALCGVCQVCPADCDAVNAGCP